MTDDENKNNDKGILSDLYNSMSINNLFTNFFVFRTSADDPLQDPYSMEFRKSHANFIVSCGGK